MFDQQQQINVGVGKQLGSAVAANRQESNPRAFRVQKRAGKAAADDLIGCSGPRSHMTQAITVREEVCPNVIEQLLFCRRRIRHRKARLDQETEKSKTSESEKEPNRLPHLMQRAQYLG